MFGQVGYKVYETLGTVWAEDGVGDTPGDHTKRKLEEGANLIVIRSLVVVSEEEDQGLEKDEAHVVISNWIQELTGSGEDLMGIAYSELLKLGEKEVEG